MVEVRQGAGGEEERRRGEEDEEEQATDIKSNNPHLAGGEKTCFVLGAFIGRKSARWITLVWCEARFEENK